MSSRVMRQALRELGRYFGIRDADAFLSAVSGETYNWNEPAPQTGLSGRAEIINAIAGKSDVHPSLAAIVDEVKKTVTDPKDLKVLNTLLCITPSLLSSVDADVKTFPWNGFPNVATPEGDDASQGFLKPDAGDVFSTGDYLTSVDTLSLIHI